MPIKTVLFDADDTLWDTQKYFDVGHDIVVSQLGKDGYKTYVDRLLGDSGFFGIGTTPVCKAYLETLIDIRNGQLSDTDRQSYENLKATLSTRPIETYENVRETLALLRRNYRVIIVTKGQLAEQMMSIAKSGLRPFVHDFQIMNKKDANEYRGQVFTKYGLDPEECVMVGNTLKTDIHPVLECGGHAIYIPRNHWHGENTHEDNSRHENYYQTDDIKNVPNIIKDIEQKMEQRPPVNNTAIVPRLY